MTKGMTAVATIKTAEHLRYIALPWTNVRKIKVVLV